MTLEVRTAPGTTATAAKGPEFVLDSFALLAYLRREPGWRPVESLLRAAAEGRAELVGCVVSLGEVLYTTERIRGAEQARAALGYVEQLPLQWIDADRSLTLRAARVKAAHAVSYADAFVIALAQLRDATVVTGDAEFRSVQKLVRVRWLAQPKGGGRRGTDR